MSRRISIRGQGAGIFFGEERTPPKDELEPAEGQAEADRSAPRRPHVTARSKPASMLASQQAGQPTDKSASQPESKQAGRSAGQQASQPAGQAARTRGEPVPGLDAGTGRRLLELLRREHRIHNTYRFHPDELAALRDIVYQLEVRWGARATRNDVVRAAVIWMVEDFNQRGEESLLVRLLREEGG